MNTHLKLIAAASMAIGGMSTVWAQDTAADRAADSARRAADSAGDAAGKAAAGQGLRGTAAAPDAEGIRDVLASSTEAAAKPGSFDDLIERFADTDRNRLGKAMPSDDARKPLDDQLKAFRADWKAKYNQEFDFPAKEEDAFKPELVRIMQGEMKAVTAGARSDTAGTALDRAAGTVDTGTVDTGTVDTGAVDTGAVGADRSAQPAAGRDAGKLDADRETGRNVAIALIPASHGMPAIEVPLVHELPDNWRIDIPDNIDAAALQASLQKQFSKCQEMKSQWPADVNDAYLAIAHHVLLSIFENSPAVQKEGYDALPAAGTISPSAAPSERTIAQPGASQ